MIPKERLRKLEYPILLTFLALWLSIYILSRLFLEMYTDHTPTWVWVMLMIIFIPLSGYAALRMAYSEGGKWYQSIGYWFIFTLGSLFAGHYMMLKGDILITALVRTPVIVEAKVSSVKKVMSRKLGFDHTEVTLQFNGKRITMDARPYTYFYLRDRIKTQITGGTSFLGNTYVISTGISVQDKIDARWQHLRDWAHRSRWFGIMIIFMILISIIKFKYFPEKPGIKPKQIGFWKAMGLIMGILMVIAAVLYLGLFVYVKLFVSR